MRGGRKSDINGGAGPGIEKVDGRDEKYRLMDPQLRVT